MKKCAICGKPINSGVIVGKGCLAALRKKVVIDIGDDIRHMQELLEAEEQGRLRLLPFKNEDTVYLVHRYMTTRPTISAIKYGDLIVRIRKLPFGDCGEVYATRAEAEAAIARGEVKGNA